MSAEIANKKKEMTGISDPVERLYKSAVRREENLLNLKKNQEKKEAEDCTFTPRIHQVGPEVAVVNSYRSNANRLQKVS